jgi:hypothetical protein
MNGAADASLDFPCTSIALEKQSERSYTPEPRGDKRNPRANVPGVTRLDPAPTILNSFSALNPDFAARLEGKQRSSIMYQALETMRGHIQGSNIKGAFLSCPFHGALRLEHPVDLAFYFRQLCIRFRYPYAAPQRI